MKRASFILMLLITFLQIKAQTNDTKSHYLKKPIVLSPIDYSKIYSKEGLINGNKELLDTIQHIEELSVLEKDSSKPQMKRIIKIDTVFKYPIIIENGFAYNIVDQIGSFSIIKFWPLEENKGQGLFQSWKIDTVKNLQELKSNLDTLNNFTIDGLMVKDKNKTTIFDLSKNYYLVKTESLKEKSIDFDNKKGLWNIGLLVLPVKIRPFASEKGQFDFADGFSVGTTFSLTVHHNWKTNFTHNLLLYVGISSYTADSSKLKEVRNDYKIATFSPAIGWMWEKNNVQLSILTGIDFPSGNLQQKWVYRNKPWVGIGVGIGLFKLGNENNTGKQENKQN